MKNFKETQIILEAALYVKTKKNSKSVEISSTDGLLTSNSFREYEHH